jgi:hypothetical protein
MIELRGFITFLDGKIEDDEGNVVFTHEEMRDLERQILMIADGRIEFIQRYNNFYQTVIFLGDLRKRSNEPLMVFKELRALLTPLEARMAGSLKVHLLFNDIESDENLLLKIGQPDEPLS